MTVNITSNMQSGKQSKHPIRDYTSRAKQIFPNFLRAACYTSCPGRGEPYKGHECTAANDCHQ